MSSPQEPLYPTPQKEPSQEPPEGNTDEHGVITQRMSLPPEFNLNTIGFGKAPSQARLVVLDTLTYVSDDGTQTTADSRFVYRPSNVDEQPYVRKLRIGEGWQPLDTGWIEECSQLLIVNEQGRFPKVYPTPEQIEEEKAKIVEVCFEGGGGGILIPPLQSARFCPHCVPELQLRCLNGTAKVTVYVFPK